MDQQSLANIKTLAVVCTQWGDTGKGKLVDYFGQWADIIARGTGGANAGHTICLGDKEYIFHLVPSGILHAEKVNVIGSGVVLDPRVLIEELELLTSQKVDVSRLFIAHNAKLVLPQHLVIDRLRESGSGKIGTTGRGIGPAYEDHYRRIGLTVNDLLNKDALVAKLKLNLADKMPLLRGYDLQLIREIMSHPHVGNGKFFAGEKFFDLEAIVAEYLEYGRRLDRFIVDTDAMLRREVGKKRILLEGAQGNLLSVDYGTYPFVTSSDCSVQGLAKGVGLDVGRVDRTIAIAKAFYITRVGEGPFPTELGGTRSAVWCGKKGVTKEVENRDFNPNSLEVLRGYHLGEHEEFALGVAIRQVGNEYGATTGRPRRVGWFDLPLLRYSSQIAGKHGREIALTKLDVLNQSPIIKVCTAYRYEGPDYRVGGFRLKKGETLKTAIPSDDVLRHCQPVYQEFPGWTTDLAGVKSRSDLPRELRQLIEFVEKEAEVTANLLSIGPDREQTIFC